MESNLGTLKPFLDAAKIYKKIEHVSLYVPK